MQLLEMASAWPPIQSRRGDGLKKGCARNWAHQPVSSRATEANIAEFPGQ